MVSVVSFQWAQLIHRTKNFTMNICSEELNRFRFSNLTVIQKKKKIFVGEMSCQIFILNMGIKHNTFCLRRDKKGFESAK